MLVEFGRGSLISKARQQPEKVRMVLDKMRADGILPTLEAVFNKLDEPLPLGYCNAGEVVALGRGLEGGDLKIGDRVVSNGPHAEIVSVPRNLVAKIPEGVSYDEASFTVVGAIGLQGIRLLNPTFGETVVVIGLGLIGLLTADLLIANGCRVLGFDFDVKKAALAASKGVVATALGPNDDPVERVRELTNGVGADGVLITASAKSNTVVSQAARMSRKRGRIVLVGVVGLELNRSEFYEKELSFQVSCSYGPGRYDEAYEQGGIDYPLALVRWTENRNFEAILQAMASGTLDVKPLISEVVDLKDFQKVYADLGGSGKIASILRYGKDPEIYRTVKIAPTAFSAAQGALAIIGAGNFTKMTVLPALRKAAVPVKYIVSSGGVSGTTLARKYGIGSSTTETATVLEDAAVAGVIITTRHNSHAGMALRALRAGKHVLVEKPLCLSRAELEDIRSFFSTSTETQEQSTRDRVSRNVTRPVVQQTGPFETAKAVLPTLCVGFNRRFSQHVRKMKELLGSDPGAMSVVATFNAGAVPIEHWVHDPRVGGGRILGEACHFIDLISFLVGSKITAVCSSGMGKNLTCASDNASIILRFQNGSHGVVNYLATGHRTCPKERVEVFHQGRNLVLENFRVLRGYGFKGFRKFRTRQDKGHTEQFRVFAERIVSGGEPMIPLDQLLNTAEASIAAVESLLSGEWRTLETKSVSGEAGELSSVVAWNSEVHSHANLSPRDRSS
jgi:predicted dehydrogenase/threonine dehydrogenase-like Zn-dependent dehydrogenase